MTMEAVKPWGHQVSMIEWYASRQSGMFAADMGVGKSGAAILAVADAKVVLYCCPPAVGPAWVKQHRMFDPGRFVLNLTRHSTAKRGQLLTEALARGGKLAVVVNYEAVWRKGLAEGITKVQWDAIVLDESHRIKAAMGKASRWLYELSRKHPKARRLCLTGTPMPHSPLDLFGQFRFLDPTVFGTSIVRMRSRYADTDPVFQSKVRSWRNMEELTAKLDRNAWRAAADEVLDLPDAIHETIEVKLSPKIMRAYRDLEENCVALLDRGEVVAANTLTKLLRLGQLTGGYLPASDAIGGSQLVDGTPSKASALEEWMEDLPVNEPVVVFCRFAADIQEVHAAARRLGRTSSEVSGNENTLERWQGGDTTVLAVQIASGGVGIDLTRACYAVYYSMSWSLGDYEQSLARLRRPGQTRCCRYYHLVAKGTVDQDVYAALRERKNVVQAVVDRLTKRVDSYEEDSE